MKIQKRYVTKKSKIKLPTCVIMAGGLGTRLGPITKKIPKPIVNVNGKPFLFYILDILVAEGFNKFIFLLSYKNKKIINKLNFYNAKKNFFFDYYLDKKKNQGTSKSLLDVKEKLSNDFFYTNADELPNFSIKQLYKKHLLKKSLISFILYKNDAEGYISKKNERIYKSRKKDKKKFIECGFKFMNKSIFETNKFTKKKLEQNLIKDKILKKCNYLLIRKLPYRIDSQKDISYAKKFI